MPRVLQTRVARRHDEKISKFALIIAAGNGHGGEVSSSGGAVDVQVDPAAHLNIDASASGGSVDCSLPLTMHGHLSHGHVEGTLQGGGAVLKLHSSGGGVSIARCSSRYPAALAHRRRRDRRNAGRASSAPVMRRVRGARFGANFGAASGSGCAG